MDKKEAFHIDRFINASGFGPDGKTEEVTAEEFVLDLAYVLKALSRRGWLLKEESPTETESDDEEHLDLLRKEHTETSE